MSTPEPSPPEDNAERIWIIGLGSECGDDRAGWQVVERLRKLLAASPDPGVLLRRASSPADLLGLIEPGVRMIVIDACQGAGPPGSYVQFNWPGESVLQARAGSGHNISLAEALKLAAALGQLSSSCEIWCLEGSQFEWDKPLSPEIAQAVEGVVAEIFRRLVPGRVAIGTAV
jgi:hydrogenase maturation protease